MGNNFVFLILKCIKTDNNSELEAQTKVFLIYNPKQLFAKLKQLKAENISKKREIAKGCSSEKERKVNALALRADEGRDYLR